ncbi:hypothetical protein Tco_0580175 [Tanacetum coccineum]
MGNHKNSVFIVDNFLKTYQNTIRDISGDIPAEYTARVARRELFNAYTGEGTGGRCVDLTHFQRGSLTHSMGRMFSVFVTGLLRGTLREVGFDESGHLTQDISTGGRHTSDMLQERYVSTWIALVVDAMWSTNVEVAKTWNEHSEGKLGNMRDVTQEHVSIRVRLVCLMRTTTDVACEQDEEMLDEVRRVVMGYGELGVGCGDQIRPTTKLAQAKEIAYLKEESQRSWKGKRSQETPGIEFLFKIWLPLEEEFWGEEGMHPNSGRKFEIRESQIFEERF